MIFRGLFVNYQFVKLYIRQAQQRQMQNSLVKEWGLQQLQILKALGGPQHDLNLIPKDQHTQRKPIVRLPLLFTYPPVQIISKQLTKLKSKYKQRIIYLGPRWADSVTWHKKFSRPSVIGRKQQQSNSQNQRYYFNQRRVVKNNNFIHDSMRQNQFFKSQLYYRAFQGMNPTLNDDQQMVFQSRFQSGNLDCVVKIDQNQYDLFCRIDTNTRGNLFWYYFRFWLPDSPSHRSRRVKLNICNISKSRTLYEKNLKPYVKRKASNSRTDTYEPEWVQGSGIYNCGIQERKLRYDFIYEKVKVSLLYQLSFQIQLQSDEQVSLAYCIPYTYSDLMTQLLSLELQANQRKIKHVFIRKIGQSLTGVQIPVLIIADNSDSADVQGKKVVFITARAHPGQSNSSLIMSSLISQLALRKMEPIFSTRVIYVIVPMLNPDGVIFGNGRCSALGKDLNRQFKTWNASLNPQVVAIKRLIDKIQQNHEIQIYFDFHGHSKKKNVFFFGPNYSVTDSNYYRSRVFPKIFSKNLEFFRYFGCSYSISQAKKTTARAIMINQFSIPLFYTVQTSVGFFHDYSKRQDIAFSKQSLSKIGAKFKQSLKQYFQGIQEYQQFIKNKKKQKAQSFQQQMQKSVAQKQSQQRNEHKTCNLRFLKYFEQIKSEQKNLERANKYCSENDSDSCRASQELQAQKTKQFSLMLITFNRIQEQKIESLTNFSVNFPSQVYLKLKHQKTKDKKFRSLANDNMNSLIKRLAIKNQFRVHSNSHRYDVQRQIRVKQVYQIQNQFDQQQKRLIPQEGDRKLTLSANKDPNKLNISAHNFFRRVDMQFQHQQNQKVGIVNFSRMVQNPKSLRYSQDTNDNRVKSRSQRRKLTSPYFQDDRIKMKHRPNNFAPFQQPKDVFLSEAGQKTSRGINFCNNSRPFPASFYRIKYQQSHKRYRVKSPDRTFSSFKGNLGKGQTISERKAQKPETSSRTRSPKTFFINISRIEN